MGDEGFGDIGRLVRAGGKSWGTRARFCGLQVGRCWQDGFSRLSRTTWRSEQRRDQGLKLLATGKVESIVERDRGGDSKVGIVEERAK